MKNNIKFEKNEINELNAKVDKAYKAIDLKIVPTEPIIFSVDEIKQLIYRDDKLDKSLVIKYYDFLAYLSDCYEHYDSSNLSSEEMITLEATRAYLNDFLKANAI